MKTKICTIISAVILAGTQTELKAQITFDATNNWAKVTTSWGNLWMGPSGTVSNYGWCHMKTDASMFFFDKTITSATGIFGAYDNTNLVFQTNANPNTAASYNITRMTILKSNGNVGIGFTSPRSKLDVNGKVIIGTTTQTGTHSDAMLTVDGKAVAKEVIVTLQNWADYVFEKDYKLPALHDVEKYYLANKHLPEIPSEKEIIENGVSVGEMNKLLLKKIEELTIYMVEQQKEIEKLKEKIK